MCHFNNFNYQLTPSIILEIKDWNKNCRIVYTAHDFKLVCPNYSLYDSIKKKKCEKCVGGQYINCLKGRCIHDSIAKSLIGTIESYFWDIRKVYSNFDTIICCSNYIKERIDTRDILSKKTRLLYNYIDVVNEQFEEKEDYVLYYGRYSWDKGIETLLESIKRLPEINFVFAGVGEYKDEINKMENISDVGFQTGEALDNLIKKASISSIIISKQKFILIII